MERKSADLIVKIFSILLWIEAVVLFLSGITLMGGGMVASSFLSGLIGAASTEIVSLMLFVSGACLALFAVFEAFIAHGIWLRQGWARVALLILCIIAVPVWPLGTVSGLIGIWLFGFNAEVKAQFGHGVAPPKPPKRKAAKKSTKRAAPKKARKKKAKKRK